MIWRFEHPPDFIDIDVAVEHKGHTETRQTQAKHTEDKHINIDERSHNARTYAQTNHKMRHKHMHKHESLAHAQARTHIHTECQNSAAVHTRIHEHYNSHAQYIRTHTNTRLHRRTYTGKRNKLSMRSLKRGIKSPPSGSARTSAEARVGVYQARAFPGEEGREKSYPPTPISL